MKEAVVVSPVVSFRDKLLGEGSTHSAAIPLEEEDEIAIGEEDYIATVENGVPSITFSDRINGLLDKRMELCVIIKLLGRRITYNVLSNKLDGLWRTKRLFHLSTLENDYYMAKFQSKEDYVMVLLPGLPSRMYVHDALTTIDKQVGKVIRVDSISEVATKTQFARIAVCGAVQVDKGKSPMPRTQATLEELVKQVETEEYRSWMVVKRKPRVITKPGNN
ncbi:hypothetical protein K2173_017645 [Erythroxylum novogranatense]|uniref:DUF4283 domain-containing protein n=1 Tax=Erythroxylum novogranatense TaxID=1862640 RepID=A0AAV8SM58_9ROSI|nr:hypothetical protein K2173_017645 [Erythroxylum novogranatense]